MSKCNINLSLPLSDINCCDSQSRRCTRAQDITRRCSVICFVIVFGAFINFYCNYHCFCCNPCFAVHLLVGSCWFLVIVLLCHVLDGNGEDREYAHFLAKMYYEQDHASATSSAVRCFFLAFWGRLKPAQAEKHGLFCVDIQWSGQECTCQHFQAMPMYRHFKLKSQFFFGKAKQELIRPCLLSESISLRLDQTTFDFFLDQVEIRVQ